MAERELSVAERSALIDVARRFYLEDRSKIEIGQDLGVSRFKVARMLEQARELGLVTITLHDEGAILADLGRELCERLGLREAVVVETSGDEAAQRRQIGLAAGEHLSATLAEGEVLGMSWGRTLTAMTETLGSLPAVSVVQLTGTVGSDLHQSPVEIVRKVASRSGGSAQPVFAPMVVDNATTARALRDQPDVARAMSLYGEVTTAMLALGSWDPLDSQLASVIPADEREELIARGVVAEVASTLIAQDGSLVAPDFTARTLAIRPEELRRIPRVVLVSSGHRKVGAARAVLRAGLITGVVTDREIAEALLADEDLRGRGASRPS